jgi:hypothetical protein
MYRAIIIIIIIIIITTINVTCDIFIVNDIYFFQTMRECALNELESASKLLMDFPPSFSTYTSSLVHFLPDSNFTISQTVLIVLSDSKIWLLCFFCLP